ncbi:MAG: MFS transporter [Planctomycetota bacterium]
MLRPLLLITGLENVASALIQISLYFYTSERLGFSETDNLLLALLHGSAYIAGALLSHPVTQRVRERNALLAILLIQIALIGSLALFPHKPAVFALSTAALFVFGLKWPIIESFVTAGRTPKQAARSVGAFNLVWSSGVALAAAASGLLIQLGPAVLFITSLSATAISFALAAVILPRQVSHLPDDHPERPDPQAADRLKALLTSARWSLVSSYLFLQILFPVLPGILEDLGLSVAAATALASVMLWVRVATFAVLERRTGWHGRPTLLAIAAVLLPLGAIITLTVPDLTAVLLGQLVFGIAMGISYYAALYYAMVIKNAAVDASGAHEAVIGTGYLAGPLVGLAAASFTTALTLGAAALPLTALALRPLLAHKPNT